ncbi:MAG: T9SS type A sorting domain-containing protein [Sphingobacteriales bacterium]|nr:T9SS type A sorting domain-containing protein [Sphingobacteriales bacterium]
MKKILRTLLAGMLLVASASVSAQCTFANPGIRLIAPPITTPGGQCSVTLEMSFDILHNPGGKYFWIHFWPTASYPDYNYPTSDPPTTSAIPGGNGALDNSVATLGFYHKGGTLDIQLSYPPDNSAPNFQSAYTIHEIENGGVLPGADRYTITGITLLLPQACTVPQSLTADLWESQAANAQTIACVSKGTSLYVNDPRLNGIFFCQVPREYSFNIHSIRTTGSLGVNYDVFVDNGDGLFNRSKDTLNVNTGSTVLNEANSFTFNSGRLGYLPYSGQKPYADQSLWVVISSPDLPNEIYALLYNSCIMLPARFGQFRAARNQDYVELNWTTLSEADNKGFYIERRTGEEEWTEAGFVATLAQDGNSEEALSYHFSERNERVAVTEYRLRQADIRGNSSYSAVRLVKGYGQVSELLIYPNPSANGEITVLVNKVSTPYQVSIYDIQGKLVHQRVNYQQPSLQITGLHSGIYTLTVTLPGTTEKITGRFVINR